MRKLEILVKKNNSERLPFLPRDFDELEELIYSGVVKPNV